MDTVGARQLLLGAHSLSQKIMLVDFSLVEAKQVQLVGRKAPNPQAYLELL